MHYNKRTKKTWQYWRLLLLAGGLILLALWLAKTGINHAYQHAMTRHVPFMLSCGTAAWAHRGQQGSLPPNSLTGITAALAAGAGGIEVDIQYLPARNRFVLAHDTVDTTTSNDQLLTLDALFSTINTSTYWWLDAKNLRNLWPWQAQRAITRLQHVIKRHKQQATTLVESSNPLYLRWLAQADIGTLFAIRPNAKKRSAIILWAHLYLSKWFYSWGPFTGITLGHDRYTQQVKDAFSSGPGVWLSTFHQPQAAARWLAQASVKAVLMETPPYPATSCH